MPHLKIFQLIFTLIFVPASLQYLERVWGSIETIKFIVVSVLFSNIIGFGFNWIEFIGTRDADMFLYVTVFQHDNNSPAGRYGMQYHGTMSLQIAILVAFTQLIPEHHVQVMGILKTRVKVNIVFRPMYQTPDYQPESPNGILDLVNCDDHSRVSVSMDHHSIWMVCRLDIPSLL